MPSLHLHKLWLYPLVCIMKRRIRWKWDVLLWAALSSGFYQSIFVPCWALQGCNPFTFCFLSPLPAYSSTCSHKDSVSPVGGWAREDLCHAWPHHAWERHQGPHHTVRPCWPWAGGHHWLGQTHPRYEKNDFCFLCLEFLSTSCLSHHAQMHILMAAAGTRPGRMEDSEGAEWK